MSSVMIKSVGTAVAAVLAALAQQNTFPAFSGILLGVAGLLAGWLHLPQPGAPK
jgi:hypothetical protein